MVIDDMLDMRVVARTMLATDEAFVVVGEAGSGLEAVRVLRDTRPDLVLLDHHLGDCTATELAPVIRSLLPEAVIIVWSATLPPVGSRVSLIPHVAALVDKDQFFGLIGVLRTSVGLGGDAAPRPAVSPQPSLPATVELLQAIESQQLALDFQPQVNVRTNAVEAVEALVRWDHPSGTRNPEEFIALAERSDLIHALTEWVLVHALTQAKAWGLPTAVNLSSRSLADGALPDLVRRALDATNTSPRLLKVELTETAAIVEPEIARRSLGEIGDMGATISIDDFGTGYCSLSHLARLPVHELKFDRSLVMELPRNPTMVAIVSGVTKIAHDLGVNVVAEGVENAALFELVTQLGLDSAQGYLIGRPMRAKVFEDWLMARV